MYMDDMKIIEDVVKQRNVKSRTKYNYVSSVQQYVKFHNLSLQKLLEEAEKEEDEGIRWKHRKLKKRLIDFRNYLLETYSEKTAKIYFSKIKSIYYTYEIEIHYIPPYSNINVNVKDEITYDDLPDKKIIKEAVKLSNHTMKALILFMVSSGCSRAETLNLTIKDFINATKEYHDFDNIYEVINQLKKQDHIIPTFKLKRQKNNKHYYTFCSFEATNAIITHLTLRKTKLKDNDKLIKINMDYMNEYFNELNKKLNLKKVSGFNRLRAHMLRKYHASQLAQRNRDDTVGLTVDEIDALQGRTKRGSRASYFLDNPNELKKVYINAMERVLINDEVNSMNVKSPEYLKIEKQLQDKDDRINEILKLQKETQKRVERELAELKQNQDRAYNQNHHGLLERAKKKKF